VRGIAETREHVGASGSVRCRGSSAARWRRALGPKQGEFAQLLLAAAVVTLGNFGIELAAVYRAKTHAAGATYRRRCVSAAVTDPGARVRRAGAGGAQGTAFTRRLAMAPLIPIPDGAVSIDVLAGRLRFGARQPRAATPPCCTGGGLVELALAGHLTKSAARWRISLHTRAATCWRWAVWQSADGRG
jgi:hypothetical protein